MFRRAAMAAILVGLVSFLTWTQPGFCVASDVAGGKAKINESLSIERVTISYSTEHKSKSLPIFLWNIPLFHSQVNVKIVTGIEDHIFDKWFRLSIFDKFEFRSIPDRSGNEHLICWRLSKICQQNISSWQWPIFSPFYRHVSTFDSYISAQLTFRRFLVTLDQVSCGPPQRQGGQEKKSRKGGQGSIRNLDSVAVERRPELGSFVAMLFSVFAAFLLMGPYGQRGIWFFLRMIIGTALVIDGLVGFLFGFDLWSLWRSL